MKARRLKDLIAALPDDAEVDFRLEDLVYSKNNFDSILANDDYDNILWPQSIKIYEPFGFDAQATIYMNIEVV